MKNLTLSTSGLSIASNFQGPLETTKCRIALGQSERSKRFQGRMGLAVRRNIKRRLTAWELAISQANNRNAYDLNLVQRKFGFMTLTIPGKQIHSHKEVKRKLLNNFLTWLKRRFGEVSYFWKAELHVSGNIHFHILIDMFVPWRDIRSHWNGLLATHGYIDRWHNSMVEKKCNIYESYKQNFFRKDEETTYKAWKHGVETSWRDPNSTDIHSLHNVKSVLSYVIKYVTKDCDKEGVISEENKTEYGNFGRTYGFSDSVNNLPEPSFLISNEELESVLELIKPFVKKVIKDDYFTFYQLDFKEALRIKRALIENFSTITFDFLPDIPIYKPETSK